MFVRRKDLGEKRDPLPHVESFSYLKGGDGMFCPKCGKELSEDAKFCPECGVSLDAATAIHEPGGKKKPVGKKARMGCFAVVGLIGFFVIVVIIVNLSSNQSEKADTPKTVQQPIETPYNVENKRIWLKNEEKKLTNLVYASKDKIEDVTWYYANGSKQTEAWQFWFYTYIGLNGYPYMRLKCGFNLNDWIFFNKILILADDKRFEIDFNEYKDKDSDVTNDGHVREWIDVFAGDNLKSQLSIIAEAKNVTVRFTGKYYKDFILSPTQKSQIKNIIGYYNYLDEKQLFEVMTAAVKTSTP